MTSKLFYGLGFLIVAVGISTFTSLLMLRDYQKVEQASKNVSAFSTVEYSDEYFTTCSSNALNNVTDFNKTITFADESLPLGESFFYSEIGNTIKSSSLDQAVSEVFGATWVTTKSYMAGDFVAELKLNQFTAQVETPEKTSIFFLKAITKDFSFFSLVLNKDQRGIYFNLGGVLNATQSDTYIGTEPVFISSIEDAKLKIMRIGSVFKAFVDLGDGEGYVEIWNKPYYVNSNEVSVGFGVQNFSLNPQEISSSVEYLKVTGCEKL